MGINNNFLLRQSLQDVDGHRRYNLYHSPDLIIHSQVTDPLQFFTDNYNSDVNEPVEKSSNYNFLYVRAKNMVNKANSGYLHVYQCGSSLFMKPSLWKDYAVSTISGKKYASFHASSNGQIVLADDLFAIGNSFNGKFCLAAVMSTETEPHIPDDFKNSDEYVNWVYTNRGVCFRNLTTEKKYTDPSYQRADRITGDGVETRSGMIKISGKNLPEGTKIAVNCNLLGIDDEKDYDPKNEPKFTFDLAPNVDAYVKTEVRTPNGKWPEDAEIEVKFYLAFDADCLSYKFGQPFSAFGLEADPLLMTTPYGRLVLSGSCATRFID